MSLDDKIYNKIKAYLNNEMNAEDRNSFEKEIERNEDLANTLSIFKTMDPIYSDTDWPIYNGDLSKLKETSNLFRGNDIEAFSKQVKSVNLNFNSNNKKKNKHFIRYVSSIAAAAIVIFSGYYFLNKNNATTELFNDYYNYKDLPSFTTQNSATNSLAEAENLFKTKQHKDALELFKSIENLKDSNYNPNLNLYIAACHIELSQYDLAHERLDNLLRSNTIDSHKAYWFKILAYLKEDDKTNTIETLKLLLENENNFNYKQAKKLLNDLN